MKLEKQKAFIIRCIFILILLILVYVGIKYVVPLLMPFIIGMVIAMSFRNIIDKIEKNSRIKRVFISILILIVFYSVVGFVISLIGIKVFDFISKLFNSLPALYNETFLPALQIVADNIADKFPSMKPYLHNFVKDFNQSVFSYVSIVSSFFFTIDYYKISNFIILQFKDEHKQVVIRMKNNVVGTLGKFMKAYSIIIFITFLELSSTSCQFLVRVPF